MRLRPVPARHLVRFLEDRGFRQVSQRGSHVKLKSEAGAIVVVPVHPGKDLKVGLVRAILRDAGIPVQDFLR